MNMMFCPAVISLTFIYFAFYFALLVMTLHLQKVGGKFSPHSSVVFSHQLTLAWHCVIFKRLLSKSVLHKSVYG